MCMRKRAGAAYSWKMCAQPKRSSLSIFWPCAGMGRASRLDRPMPICARIRSMAGGFPRRMPCGEVQIRRLADGGIARWHGPSMPPSIWHRCTRASERGECCFAASAYRRTCLLAKSASGWRASGAGFGETLLRRHNIALKSTPLAIASLAAQARGEASARQSPASPDR